MVAWFDRSYSLGLSPAAEADLTAYVEAVGAVDRPFDDRPLAKRLDQTFAYLSLLTSAQTNRHVWVAAIEAVRLVLANAPSSAHALRGDLARLAADWAGSIAER